MTISETIMFYVCLGVVPLLLLSVMLVIHSKQCKKVNKIEKYNASNMKDIITLAKRLKMIEKVNGRQVINPDRIEAVLKEIENEEKNEEE